MGSEPEVKVGTDATEESAGIVSDLINEIVSSPLNIALVLAIFFLLYKIIIGRKEVPDTNIAPQPPPLPKLKKRDMQLAELRKFDGTQADGRVLVAINGKIFDVTRGKRFYGPGMSKLPIHMHMSKFLTIVRLPI